MRRVQFTFASVLATVLVSCSVKEYRGGCPSYVSITVKKDSRSFDGGRGYINLYKGSLNLDSGTLTGLQETDTTLAYAISPRGEISAVVSSHPVFADKIVAYNNAMFPKLFISKTELMCIHEQESFHVDGYCKEHIVLYLRLDDTAKQTEQALYYTVESRYDGINVITMRPSEGGFRHASVFDRDGLNAVVIPRQAGTGLKLTIEKPGSFKTDYDIYRVMQSAGYNFNSSNLDDFDVIISLNTISGRIRVSDWNRHDIDNTDF